MSDYNMDEQSMLPEERPEQAAPAASARSRVSMLTIVSLVLSSVALVLSLWALLRTLPPVQDKHDPAAVYAEPGTVITYKDRQLPPLHRLV